MIEQAGREGEKKKKSLACRGLKCLTSWKTTPAITNIQATAF